MRVRGGRLEPDDDIEVFPFRVPILFSRSFVDAAVHRTSKLRRSYARRPRPIKLHANRKDTMGVLVLRHYMFRRGCVWKCEHVRWTPCRFSPPGDARRATLAHRLKRVRARREQFGWPPIHSEIAYQQYYRVLNLFKLKFYKIL